jgi:hypothetical protein
MGVATIITMKMIDGQDDHSTRIVARRSMIWMKTNHVRIFVRCVGYRYPSQGYWISNFEYPDSNMDVEYSDSGMEYPTSIWTRLQSLGYDFNFFFF